MTIVTALPLPALVTALCAALALSGCGVSVDLSGTAVERTESESIDAEGVRSLQITTANGRVDVIGGGTDEIELTVLLRESDSGDADYTARRHGDRVLVEGHCDGGWFERCSVGFEVVVPPGMAVEVGTDNGRIDVAGPTDRVDLESANGAITGDGLTAPIVRARTDNGRIDLVFASAPDDVTTTTDNGAISIRFPDDGGAHDVTASSDNGSVDVDVRTDPAAERHVDASSDNGSVAVAYAP